jgi:site-specific recombinase XerD
MLNADADLVTLQDFLGHTRIKMTDPYCRVSNRKVGRDYYNAMTQVIQRHRVERKMLDKEELVIY